MHMPYSNGKGFALSEKGKVLDLRKGKKLYAVVAKIYDEKKSSINEINKWEKEICANFGFVSQTIKVIVNVCGKCLVKIKKGMK